MNRAQIESEQVRVLSSLQAMRSFFPYWLDVVLKEAEVCRVGSGSLSKDEERIVQGMSRDFSLRPSFFITDIFP